MPPKMEKFLQIAPHSLAIVLGPAEGPAGERSGPAPLAPPAQPRQLSRHHIGYEIFADFKAENMQHFWNKKVTAAVAETFFLGWIDEQVLLIQGKEEHLEVLREGWTRRALRPPSGFHIRCLGESGGRGDPPHPAPSAPRARGHGKPRPLPWAPRASLPLRSRPGEGPAALCERGIGGQPGGCNRGRYLSPHASGRPAEPPRRRGGAGGWPGRRRRWRARRGECAAAPGLVSGTFSAEIGPGECVRAGEMPRERERIQVASGGCGFYRGRRRRAARVRCGRGDVPSRDASGCTRAGARRHHLGAEREPESGLRWRPSLAELRYSGGKPTAHHRTYNELRRRSTVVNPDPDVSEAPKCVLHSQRAWPEKLGQLDPDGPAIEPGSKEHA
ncbi:translation initiation factor IF-2-like [Phyllostomus discolor]|uniref:Translation initiation factor IF-2-like n=1 Tax=Phyllostomus discolor TaxID=89673 RepID=A0A7E6CJE4_9CHIR|nr:translation initiation factor IF-2-like [Phyllostomus discolor]